MGDAWITAEDESYRDAARRPRPGRRADDSTASGINGHFGRRRLVRHRRDRVPRPPQIHPDRHRRHTAAAAAARRRVGRRLTDGAARSTPPRRITTPRGGANTTCEAVAGAMRPSGFDGTTLIGGTDVSVNFTVRAARANGRARRHSSLFDDKRCRRCCRHRDFGERRVECARHGCQLARRATPRVSSANRCSTVCTCGAGMNATLAAIHSGERRQPRELTAALARASIEQRVETLGERRP